MASVMAHPVVWDHTSYWQKFFHHHDVRTPGEKFYFYFWLISYLAGWHNANGIICVGINDSFSRLVLGGKSCDDPSQSVCTLKSTAPYTQLCVQQTQLWRMSSLLLGSIEPFSPVSCQFCHGWLLPSCGRRQNSNHHRLILIKKELLLHTNINIYVNALFIYIFYIMHINVIVFLS